MTDDPQHTPTGLAPSADSPQQKREKVQIGRGFVAIICGVAIASFALYIFVVAYGILKSG
jgi:hypothetical protein